VIASAAARAERAEDLHAHCPCIACDEQCKLRIRCIFIKIRNGPARPGGIERGTVRLIATGKD
jgi:hypothetical protein